MRQTLQSIAIASMLTAFSISAGQADLLNASYINTQPAPFGSLTETMATTYGSTKFNRFNIMGLSFCDPADTGCTPYNPVQWGGQPIMTYSNDSEGNPTWAAASPDAAKIVAALKFGGASVYASIVGGNTVPYLIALDAGQGTATANTCAEKGPDVNTRACAAFYLSEAFTAYGTDGLDIDIESDWSSPRQYTDAQASEAFETLLDSLTENGTIQPPFGMSFAPYYDKASNPVSASTTAGACVYKKYGITGYIDARQYYAGGTQGTTLDGLYTDVQNLLATLSDYPCPDGSTLNLASTAVSSWSACRPIRCWDSNFRSAAGRTTASTSTKGAIRTALRKLQTWLPVTPLRMETRSQPSA
ncbi:hypothetical protein [Labrenzia sp. OB1]|uniref:hypothetical protein n=1 Tax=Labrenzia sp. OB1 TaxID=1561204 RepID=UPI0007B30355|nr:hypothetical protein [Labrenzia sp. OB1]KZM47428.1 hypothetical protein OA90_26080 [Labrenzia sp. OB1]